MIFDCEINEVDGRYRIGSDQIRHLFLQGESDQRTPLLGGEARLLPDHTFLPLDNLSWTKDGALHTSCKNILHSLSSFLCFFLLGGDASPLVPPVLLVLNLFNSWPWRTIYFRPKIFSRMLFLLLTESPSIYLIKVGCCPRKSHLGKVFHLIRSPNNTF